MITLRDIINNIELQDKIIYTVFSLDFEKNVKHLIGYLNKKYKLNLDESEKEKLGAIFYTRIREMMAGGKIIKRERGYVLASMRINFSEIKNEKNIFKWRPIIFWYFNDRVIYNPFFILSIWEVD